jgi:hypothetical protein
VKLNFRINASTSKARHYTRRFHHGSCNQHAPTGRPPLNSSKTRSSAESSSKPHDSAKSSHSSESEPIGIAELSEPMVQHVRRKVLPRGLFVPLSDRRLRLFIFSFGD